MNETRRLAEDMQTPLGVFSAGLPVQVVAAGDADTIVNLGFRDHPLFMAWPNHVFERTDNGEELAPAGA